MRTAARHVFMLAMLALLVGHASLAVHAASHPLADTVDCQICVSYGAASQAPLAVPEPSDGPHFVQPATFDTAVEPSQAWAIHYDQRGPPVWH